MIIPINLVPVDSVEPDVLASICRAISETLNQECSVQAPAAMPKESYNPRREQFSAEAVLEEIEPGGTRRALGVVERDLYVRELNFVFGLADPANERAIIALPRLHERFYRRPEDRQLFLERAAKEAIHELGHTFGLGHCSNPRCVMAFSNSLPDTDYKRREFCAECRTRLPIGNER